MRLLDVELVHEAGQVAHQELHGVIALGRLGVAVAAQVVAQQAVILAESRHLRIPHGEIVRDAGDEGDVRRTLLPSKRYSILMPLVSTCGMPPPFDPLFAPIPGSRRRARTCSA